MFKTLLYGVVGLLSTRPRWKTEKITISGDDVKVSKATLKAGGLYWVEHKPTGQWAIYDEQGEKMAEGVDTPFRGVVK